MFNNRKIIKLFYIVKCKFSQTEQDFNCFVLKVNDEVIGTYYPNENVVDIVFYFNKFKNLKKFLK